MDRQVVHQTGGRQTDRWQTDVVRQIGGRQADRCQTGRQVSDRQVLRLDGLRHRADLVDFEQQTVTGLLVDGLLDPPGVGHR